MFEPCTTDFGVTYRAVWLGRKEAEALLAINVNNRRPRPRGIKAYTQAILDNRFRWSVMVVGGGTVTDNSARMLDGQNRCIGLIAADNIRPGVRIPVLLIENAPHTDQDHLDSGKARTAADQLEMRNEKDAKTLAAAIRLMILWDRGDIKGNDRDVTHHDVLDYLSDHPEVRDAVATAKRVKRGLAEHKIGGAPAALSAAVARCRDVDEEAAAEFFDAFASGAMLPERSPILALRGAFSDMYDNGKGALASQPKTAWYQVALILKAWNLWRAGKGARSIRFAPDREKYPEAA